MIALGLVDEVKKRVDRLDLPFSRDGIDPFGIDKKALVPFFSLLGAMHNLYFDVHHHGIEHVPRKGRGVIVGNHSGGVPLDAGMILASLFFAMEPPRLGHAMVEKFVYKMPFAGTWYAKCGQLSGLPEHAERVLEGDRLMLVFPEGARGTEKLYSARHSLVDFGTGFMRLSLQTRSPIVPVAFVGGGEAIPTIFNSHTLGKLFGAPYVPFTPWILPVPIPARLDVLFGEPMTFAGTGSEEDDVIEGYVAEVKGRIAQLIEEGRRLRGELPRR
jgi:1-acyl-sn-glycerol-3-phosphate acyltransferase